MILKPLVHPAIQHPDSVTHLICPQGPRRDGRPVSTLFVRV